MLLDLICLLRWPDLRVQAIRIAANTKVTLTDVRITIAVISIGLAAGASFPDSSWSLIVSTAEVRALLFRLVEITLGAVVLETGISGTTHWRTESDAEIKLFPQIAKPRRP